MLRRVDELIYPRVPRELMVLSRVDELTYPRAPRPSKEDWLIVFKVPIL